MTAFRNLGKSRVYTAINIIGLAVGVTCAIYITLFIREELSYDRYHKNADQIYRVAGKYDQGGGDINNSAVTTFQLAPQLEIQYPQVKRAVRIDPNHEQVVRYKDQVFRQSGIMYADSGFFDMFSFEILHGKKKSILKGDNSAVISRELAQKYFGTEQVVGRRLEVNDWPVQITAVIKPMPQNSHFHSGLIISMSVIEDEYPDWVRNNWSGTSHYTYLHLDETVNPLKLEDQINEEWDKNLTDLASSHDFFLQPLKDIHLRSNLSYEIEANSDIAYLYIFGVVGVIVLMMTCINYMNLATARSIDRTKEVGIRKVLGADRKQIRIQFFSESIIVAIIAVLLGLLLAELAIPYVNSITGKAYAIDWSNGLYWGMGLFILALVLGFFSGSYPAILVSMYNAADTIKGGKSNVGTNSNLLRKTLVVVQFAASIAILISTAVVFKQLEYMRSKNLGINTSEVVTIPFQTADIREKYEVFKDRLLTNPNVLGVTATNNSLSSRVTHWRGYELEGGKESVTIPTMIVGFDFFETLQAEFVTGRGFSEKYPTDKTQAYVINEAAAKYLGLQEPVGTPIKGRAFTGSEWSTKDANIVGVVKDFHMASLHEKIQPTIFSLSSEITTPLTFMAVRLNSENLQSTLQFLDQTWSEFTQKYPFDYQFLDQQIQQQYENDQRFLAMFTVFAILAILVACFGVFGLAAFSANRRRKEFGIRKVLGATGSGIVWLISREYTVLVLVANLIAWPIAWWFMRGWLQDFAYRIALQVWEFIGMGIFAFAIIILTVGYQAVKAANMNPVNSLRSE